MSLRQLGHKQESNDSSRNVGNVEPDVDHLHCISEEQQQTQSEECKLKQREPEQSTW